MKQIVIYILSCNRTKSQKVAPKQEHFRKLYLRIMPLSYLRGIFLRCLAISTSGKDMNDLGAIFLIFNYMW